MGGTNDPPMVGALGWRWLLAVLVAIISRVVVGRVSRVVVGRSPMDVLGCYAEYFGALTFAPATDGPSGLASEKDSGWRSNATSKFSRSLARGA